ncbi:type IV pilin [Methanococcoides seepicolus]|uniref:Type IV pilin N-terminal domain-containing protein n=1 Tax=Methanococcoides seepicolus TaxID=2828780 RepID=A0A9E5DDT0_9EURY|nr:type IV pilin N-terminal domain-containing protein [Methanococcoides seepicolus]MCM1987819.1 type IV pilin N-terminal domain-containing protein [Methanococcoides seepicolus]
MFPSRSFTNDKSGVSPVIGVMLMIVVTVILAAAVSSFSGSIATKNDVPSATFKASASFSEQNITIEHLGGDPIYKNFVKFEISYGRPTMSNYVDKSNVTFYPKNGKDFAEDVLGPGKVAKISFPIKALVPGDEYANVAEQMIAIGQPFEIKVIDRETDLAIYSTKIIMGP